MLRFCYNKQRTTIDLTICLLLGKIFDQKIWTDMSINNVDPDYTAVLVLSCLPFCHKQNLEIKVVSLEGVSKIISLKMIMFYFNRSSVTRMSVEQKHNVMKIVEPERITLDPKIVEKEEEKIKSSSSSASDEETSESETGR